MYLEFLKKISKNEICLEKKIYLFDEYFLFLISIAASDRK